MCPACLAALGPELAASAVLTVLHRFRSGDTLEEQVARLCEGCRRLFDASEEPLRKLEAERRGRAS